MNLFQHWQRVDTHFFEPPCRDWADLSIDLREAAYGLKQKITFRSMWGPTVVLGSIRKLRVMPGRQIETGEIRITHATEDVLRYVPKYYLYTLAYRRLISISTAGNVTWLPEQQNPNK